LAKIQSIFAVIHLALLTEMYPLTSLIAKADSMNSDIFKLGCGI